MQPIKQLPIEELLKQDRYSPDELAALLDIDLELIRHSAFSGDLPARVVDHHIIDIQRADAIQWMNDRE